MSGGWPRKVFIRFRVAGQRKWGLVCAFSVRRKSVGKGVPMAVQVGQIAGNDADKVGLHGFPTSAATIQYKPTMTTGASEASTASPFGQRRGRIEQ